MSFAKNLTADRLRMYVDRDDPRSSASIRGNVTILFSEIVVLPKLHQGFPTLAIFGNFGDSGNST